jgi:hypothetical protein
MTFQSPIGPILVMALAIYAGDAGAADDAKYPDWTGQWERFVVRGLPGQPSFDQTKSWGFGQEAPLTPEYRKVLEESMADQAEGGLGNYHTPRCLAAGMPLMMIAFRPLEFSSPAGDHLYSNRQRRSPPPHLHGRARLAG